MTVSCELYFRKRPLAVVAVRVGARPEPAPVGCWRHRSDDGAANTATRLLARHAVLVIAVIGFRTDPVTSAVKAGGPAVMWRPSVAGLSLATGPPVGFVLPVARTLLAALPPMRRRPVAGRRVVAAPFVSPGYPVAAWLGTGVPERAAG